MLAPARLALLALAVGLFGAAACKVSTSSTPNDAGAAGAGGCPVGSRPQFTLYVKAKNGPVPPDTTIVVRWSAAEEDPFVLCDPSTWKSADEGANVECDVARDAAPPVDLEELVCELWTSGATEVKVNATGYLPFDQTFTPQQIEQCKDPVPSDVQAELVRDPDAGVL
jgi:hypothetical protein